MCLLLFAVLSLFAELVWNVKIVWKRDTALITSLYFTFSKMISAMALSYPVLQHNYQTFSTYNVCCCKNLPFVNFTERNVLGFIEEWEIRFRCDFCQKNKWRIHIWFHGNSFPVGRKAELACCLNLQAVVFAVVWLLSLLLLFGFWTSIPISNWTLYLVLLDVDHSWNSFFIQNCKPSRRV